MKFEKLYMFNPFDIVNVDSLKISETYKNLQEQLLVVIKIYCNLYHMMLILNY